MFLREIILNKLRGIRIPDQNLDIVTAGLVKSIDVDDRALTICLKIQPDNTGPVKCMCREIKKLLNDYTGSYRIRITAYDPNTQVERILEQSETGPGCACIGIAGTSYGTSKAAVSLNLGVALARLKYHIGIVDSDLYGPGILSMLEPGFTSLYRNYQSVFIGPYSVKIIPLSYFLAEGSVISYRSSGVETGMQKLLEICHQELFDITLIDLPPGSGDVTASVVQMFQLDGVVIVGNPHDLGELDLVHCTELFRNTDIPIYGFIGDSSYINMDSLTDDAAQPADPELRVLARLPLEAVFTKKGWGVKNVVSKYARELNRKTFYDLAQQIRSGLSVH